MTTHRRSLASILFTILAALLIAGCGGSDSDSGSSGGDSGSKSGGGGDTSEAKSIFTSTCGGCHTLADAGTGGAVGPNLDEVKPDADRVKQMIDNGGGGMPAGLLDGEERDSVADYVAGAAGK